jgi:hypothetical protein
MMKMRTPAYVHSPESYLNSLCAEFCTLEAVLFRLRDEGKIDDPVERMKYISIALLSSISSGIENQSLKSPLNPILGETLVVETERGSILYAEQTSHHPPISHVEFEGPPEFPFYLYGYLEFKLAVSKGFQACYFSTPGKIFLKLPNNSVIELGGKKIEVSGLLSSTKLFNVVETQTYRDIGKRINATITFDSSASKRTSYMMSWVKGSDKVNKETGVLDNRRDLVSILI